MGAKVVEMTPVVALNATMLERVSTAPPVLACTWVKLPPSTIVEPTWAIALTLPSMMFGV